MDKLNELSSSLLDLIPWHTREGLDKLVTEDNERYRAVADTIAQQVDKINKDMLKSQQVNPKAHLTASLSRTKTLYQKASANEYLCVFLV